MYPRPSEVKPKPKKPSDVNVSKNLTVKDKSPGLDVQVSGSWSMTPARPTYLAIDHVLHFSMYIGIVILAVYMFVLHRMLYLEMEETSNLKNKVHYMFELNQHLDNMVKSVSFDLDIVKSRINDKLDLRSDIHVTSRRRRSAQSQNKDRNRTHRKNRRRNKTIETVAVQFRTSDPNGYGNCPMEGVLGPWFEGAEVGKNMDTMGVSLVAGYRQVEISKAGLYFVYSQVTYLSKGTLVSYSINVISSSNTTGEISNDSVAQCNTVGSAFVEAEVSCYTSTLRLLYNKDVVYLQQNQINRTIVFDNDMTYFGLILLKEL